MRLHVTMVALAFVGTVLPVDGQPKGPSAPFKIDFEPSRDVAMLDKHQGKEGLFLQVRFSVALEGDKPADDAHYKIIVKEDGRRVYEEDIHRPTASEDLSVVLAVDTSGSMKQFERMAQAKSAANVFLSKLPASADCGLILFDHEMRPPILPPVKNRNPLKSAVQSAQPRGGTAYLDATVKGIEMLRPFVKRERAVVVLTDGIDLGSQSSVEDVIRQARKERTRVYTIGIGEPGKMEPVNSVLVLDHSGSMKPPAEDGDTISKIEALHRAASRFVKIIPSTGRASLLPFNSVPARPSDFSNNKTVLVKSIQALQPEGETCLFDATYAAICTLEAENPKGKRAVIAMTDGFDNSSRRRVEEVIERAKEARIALFMLGFGRTGELDAASMTRMANATKGQYFHAKNEKDLLVIFENLSIQLHDDGIDEVTLTKLARDTGGSYYPAKNVKDLSLILERVTKNIQKKSFEVTFPSLRQVRDGTQRAITLELARSSGELVSNTAGGEVKEEILDVRQAGYQTQGVVLAEMDSRVYLGLLGVVGLLIALPSMMKRAKK